ncbi:hypothetical protein O1611_g9906 [Lasiodiplodia mahajangana]|uniref:Uncharacterized protein n=1 Tax=Lasiodiplodia mahajangana TaxID=1108764 RepID=A0ACC2J451_9PEZI|nr:hypothetical protein O1611_g9906 [Lasiodiplodia mahajangana]
MSALQVTSPTSPPTSFPQFSKLPTELRIIIWELAMEEGRIIPLFHCPPGYIQRRLTISGMRFGDVPLFFFVNSECREVAAKRYIKTRIIVKAVIMGFSMLEAHLLLADDDKLVFYFTPFGTSKKAPAPQLVAPEIYTFFDIELMYWMRDWADSLWMPHNWDQRTKTSGCVVEVYQQQGGSFEIPPTDYSDLPNSDSTDVSKFKVRMEVRVLNLKSDVEYYTLR